MIDGSKYPFEENIKLTKRVVDYAHERSSCRGRTGTIGRNRRCCERVERDAFPTDPDQAVEFVERTGVD